MNNWSSLTMNQSEKKYKQALTKASDHIKTLLSEIDTLKKSEPIAIIGMACRFPGNVNSPDDFWKLIENRVDAIREVPKNRWDANTYYDPDPEAPGKMYTKMGGFLDEIENFDAQFFGISPKELRSLDPQQRLLLETSWQAFENSGIDITTLKGSNTGVFVGILNTDYARSHLFSMDFNRIDAYSITGMSFSTASGRVSYFYGLEGPNIAIDTACSSSLVSVHLACHSLKNHECNMAVAGGVNLILTPEVHIGFCKMKALSPDGRCKSFDASADGLSRGEGCGMIVLKRLSDATKDGDPILAIIKESAVNQDGKSNGLAAPNGLAQRKVIKSALSRAGIKPDAVSYIEAHGSGTPLGDPIEMNAIGSIYGQNRDSDNVIYVGSVKANIGHLESAAGVASIIKTVLAINNKKIPPQLHYNEPNPEIAWNDFSVKIPTKLTPWTNSKKIAGVSAFGFGGTNAHIILEQAPEVHRHIDNHASAETKAPLYIIPISAKSNTALNTLISQYKQYIEKNSKISVGDISVTACQGRGHFHERTYVIGHSKQEISNQLKKGKLIQSTQRLNPKLVFMFTGQGSQYPKMGWDLYETQPVFRESLDQCSEFLEPDLKISLIDLLYHSKDSDHRIHQAFYTQPAIFSVEYALGKVWESWGIRPSVVMGHSIGEYAAACIAGVFSLKDGLKLVTERGRLISSLPENGAMATVIADKDKVVEIIDNYKDKISLAAVNAPENILISGQRTAIEDVIEIFADRDIPARLMQISHAIHSLLMEPIQDALFDVASKIQFSQPVIPIISNVSGKHAGDEISTPDYWVRHIRQDVRFYESMLTLDKEGYEIFLEIGSTSTLSSLGMQCLPRNKGLWLQSLGINNAMFNMRPGRTKDYNDWKPMLHSLGQLYIHGMDIHWSAFENQFKHKKVVLPNYPFQRERYWIPPVYKKENDQNTKEIPQEAVSTFEVEDTTESQISEKRVSNIRHSKNTRSQLLSLVHQVSEIQPSKHEYDTSLLSLGFDSLMISRLQRAILHTFEIEMPISSFFTHTQSINEISDFIETQLPGKNYEEKQTASLPDQKKESNTFKSNDSVPEKANISSYESIVSQQLALMSKQLDFLSQQKTERPLENLESCLKPSKDFQEMDNETLEKKQGNFRSMKFEPDSLTARQKIFIQEFLTRYNQKHQKSKQFTDKNRPVLCDWINSLNFRMSLKEINYPVVHDRSDGARIWDIDGNEFIDMAMGYGVSFLGNKPSFITQAISQQMEKGFELGPQADLAGDVASLIAELTGVERVTFCNTGSESVMVALRVARKVTGKRKIVLFSGSFHGTSDAVMADTDENGVSYPTAPGNPPSMVKDVIVLDYGTDASLKAIQKLAETQELAAVLVEPVQSRRPGFQPKEFLTNLRHITEQTQTALIFDEVLTGFRIHPGGCQAWFNIQADIVTYGKIVSGGMPIGVVAGKAAFLDALDGGMWQFGDHSYPIVKPTVFAGTFCKHPLVMAAAKAALLYMKENGAKLQEKVNSKTAYFANTLNAFFKTENIAIKIEYFGSVFRFESYGGYSLALLPIEMELLFYLLLEKGVYTWERRICFFSIAHTDDDIERIIKYVKESIWEIRAGGFKLEASINQPIPAVKHSRHYPMSKAQKRLFVLSEIDGEQDAYQIAQAAIFEGAPDIQKFEDSFIEIVNRHEILRTSFALKEGKLIQKIHDHVDFKVDYHKEAGENINDLIKKYCKPLALSKAPVFKVVLLQLSLNRYLMIAITHHMIIDGLSWNIIVQDFCALYETKSLPPLSNQYVDYVFWEQDQLQTEKMKQDETYWKDKCSNEIQSLNLPTDFQRPAQRSSKGGTHFFTLPEEKLKQLKILAGNTRSTITMIFLAAYNIFLHKLTGQENIIIGIPVDSRPPDGFDNVVGMFVNTMPSQNQPKRELSFNDFIQHVKQNALNDYNHRNYPFDLIVNNLNPEKDLSRNALIDTLLVYESADERFFELKDLSFTPCEYKNDVSAYDLVLEIIEQNNAASLNFEYSTDLFKHETIIRWSDYFLKLINEIIAHPQLPISKLNMIPSKEQQHILVDFNNTSVDYPTDKTLVDLFETQVKRTPEQIAVIFQDIQLTYNDLNRQANRVAHFLKEEYHIVPEDCVGLFFETSQNMIIGILGILKAGGAYVPVNTAYPLDRISYILQDSRCKLVLTENNLIQTEGFTCIDINTTWHPDDQNPFRNADPDNPAYVIYTSGSTGTPKGVIIEHQSIINTVLWRSQYYSFRTTDRVLQLPSYAFDSSVEDIFTPLISGSSLVFIPQEKKLDLEYIGDLVELKNITHFLATPAFYKTFLNNIPDKLKDLRFVTVAGENIGNDLVSLHFEKLKYVKLFNEYGPTENSVCATVFEFLSDNHHVLIGKPISNNLIYILDPDKNLCPIGIIGEICISGRGLARGYLNRADLTKEKFIKNPFQPGKKMYCTGDLGRWLPDGNIEFLGRMDDQVKIRGFRVESGEIEKQIKEYPSVKEAVIVARKNSEDITELTAYVIAHKHLEISSLRRHLTSVLPDYMIPSFFVSLETLPLTPNGKIDKKALPLPDKDVLTTTSDFKKPRNPIEEQLVWAWEKVLGRKKIGINDNYFELGGDSIKAIQVVAFLNQKNLKMQVRDIFQYPVIAELAEQITEVIHNIDQSTITGNVPLTAIQAWFFKTHMNCQWINHYNQAVVIHAKNGLQEDAVRMALKEIQTHHDVLRMKYTITKNQIIQTICDLEYPLSLNIVDLNNADQPDYEYTNHARNTQTRIDLENGPLMKAVLFKFKAEDRLLIVIHHLIIDAVSWQLLLDDFIYCYEQILSKKSITLPEKTNSFKLWSEKIHTYANSEKLLKEQSYWESIDDISLKTLPKDCNTKDNLYKDLKTAHFKLSQENTNRLLKEVNHAYNTDIQDILITALAKSIKSLNGRKKIPVMLESHGRVDLFDDVNITRTAGWFTSEYPVVLELPDTNDSGQQIKLVKETLRNVPDKGIGYGILKYITTEGKQSLNLKPEIIFNYLGQFNWQNDQYEIVEVLDKQCISPELNRSYILEIEGMVIRDRFQLIISYNKKHYKSETIEKLMLNFEKGLLELINHCKEKQSTELTPADLTYKGLELDDLDDIFM